MIPYINLVLIWINEILIANSVFNLWKCYMGGTPCGGRKSFSPTLHHVRKVPVEETKKKSHVGRC